MKVFVTGFLVTVGLAVLLLWKNPPISRRTYRAAFLLGLAAFASIAILPGSSSMISQGRSPLVSVAIAPFLIIIANTPFILLIEAGIAGYKGFEFWMRYVSAAIAVFGGVGLLISLLLRPLLRSRGA